MAHEIAKLVLEHSETFLERTEAVKTALGMGMPLNEIEAYLDWLAVVRDRNRGTKADPPQDIVPPPEGQE